MPRRFAPARYLQETPDQMKISRPVTNAHLLRTGTLNVTVQAAHHKHRPAVEQLWPCPGAARLEQDTHIDTLTNIN